MAKNALVVWGGWEGHTPRESAEVFAPWLRTQGFNVEVVNTLEVYADAAKMAQVDLVVPIWSIGQITWDHPGMRGIFLVIEATKQLRGECEDRQVKGCQLAFVHGIGGTLGLRHSGASLVLGV